MGFLAPFFLAGLAAIAVPVLIHLINRERKEVIAFPSLMFLQKIPYKSVRRQKLRHLLLLALRCLAIFIVVSAFARPFFQRTSPPTLATGGAREVVVLLDRSYSMGYADRWTRAQDDVRRVAASLGPSDRATIVTFAHDPRVITEPTADRARLDAAVRNTTLSAEDTRFAPALKLAERILRGSNLSRKEVVIVSDFQKIGWTRPEEVSFPTGTKVTVQDVGVGATADVAVSRVTTSLEGNDERPVSTVAARLTNTGTAPRTLKATLELGGRAVETKSVTVPARGATQVSFSRQPVPLGESRGMVRLEHDALPQNDDYRFMISPTEALSVLLVEPSNQRANAPVYLTRALSLGERPTVRVDTKSIANVSSSDLVGRSLVVLADVPLPDNKFGSDLRAFVRDGGGLLYAPGTSEGAPSAEWLQVLPARVGQVVDRTSDAGGTLAWVEYSHPVFELFDAPRSGDFSTARFLRYRQLTTRADSGVIGRFDDGAPALVERTVGTGRAMLWSSTLDTYWTDLPLQALWVPLAHQLVRHAGRYADARPSYGAGEALDLSRHAELLTGFPATKDKTSIPIAVESPSGRIERLDAAAARPVVNLEEQGFYELRPAGAAKGAGRFVAVNPNPVESDLARLDPQELVAAVGSGRGGGADAGALNTPTKEERERRQTMWWYLLAGALVLLAVETVMSNRLSRASA
jgi:Aerotolerance regulator N-terminal/von Willebrand factor type A domain